MTISITPKSALSSTPPAVGIFWLVADSIVIDRSTLDEAETYGDCITHAAGHYERWLEWISRTDHLNRIRRMAPWPGCL